MTTPRHLFNYANGEESACVGTAAVALLDVLARFEDYLKACGYTFDGHVTICRGEECPHMDTTAPADLEPTEDGKEGV